MFFRRISTSFADKNSGNFFGERGIFLSVFPSFRSRIKHEHRPFTGVFGQKGYFER